MNVHRPTIIGMTLSAMAVVLASPTVSAAEPSPSVEGTLYAAAPKLQHQSAEPKNTQPSSTSSNVTPVRDLQADSAVSGSEPDPETFDKVGLESWWRQHRRAAK